MEIEQEPAADTGSERAHGQDMISPGIFLRRFYKSTNGIVVAHIENAVTQEVYLVPIGFTLSGGC